MVKGEPDIAPATARLANGMMLINAAPEYSHCSKFGQDTREGEGKDEQRAGKEHKPTLAAFPPRLRAAFPRWARLCLGLLDHWCVAERSDLLLNGAESRTVLIQLQCERLVGVADMNVANARQALHHRFNFQRAGGAVHAFYTQSVRARCRHDVTSTFPM